MRHPWLVVPLLALLAAPALAHGGQYKGPSDAGGPSASGGSNSGPPTNPSGANSPGPSAPSSGAGSGPTSGADTRGGNKKGVTSGGQIDFGTSYESWEFWWENNKDQYLNLKDRMAKGTSSKTSQGHLTGRGRKDTHTASRRPDVTRITMDVIPVLTELIKNSNNRDIIDSSVLAMARSAGEESADAVIATATPLLAHTELSVQTAATLSLGVLGSPKAIPQLTDLMNDSSKGRQLAGGRGQVEWLVRSFAALSLGLINEQGSVATLTQLVSETADTDKDLKVCAIVSLGLMQNKESPQACEFLLKLLEDRKLDAIIKSYVPTSLAKLCSRMESPDPRVVPALHKLFTDRDTDNFVRQSAAIALGLLATIDQPEVAKNDVVKSLLDYVAEGKDTQTRHFCFIALAQIGLRDEHMADHLPTHQALQQLFAKEVTKPSVATNRSWAALAAAIYARTQRDAESDLVPLIAEAYQNERDPSFKSAFALSLGLLGVASQAPVIFEDFQKKAEQDFKGYAAVALGFLNFTDAADPLKQICQQKTITPTYRLQVATGLGLMGDPEAVDVLIGTLESSQTLGVSSAVAKALGLIGDSSAIDPLKKIATDKNMGDITRAFACVALGMVCEKTSLPWNARISADNNYRARVPAIDEILDIL
jgi:HEAT repeat protein